MNEFNKMRAILLDVNVLMQSYNIYRFLLERFLVPRLRFVRFVDLVFLLGCFLVLLPPCLKGENAIGKFLSSTLKSRIPDFVTNLLIGVY